MSDILKITQDPDFIAIKRYSNNISALVKRYPEGCPIHIIAQALEITEEEVEIRYQQIISCLRTLIGVDFKE
jgi:hypothetical protein